MEEKMAKQASYIDRLNILSSDIETIKKLIKESISNCINCWEKKFNIDKQTFHIIGPAGVGKTQACYQIANEIANELDIQFDVILIKVLHQIHCIQIAKHFISCHRAASHAVYHCIKRSSKTFHNHIDRVHPTIFQVLEGRANWL